MSAPGPKCEVQIFERPLGFIDDHFRAGWNLIQSAASQSFQNNGGLVADLATMTVTESDVSDGCKYEKNIEALGLSTNTYTKTRIRLKGSGYSPMYNVWVAYTDGSHSDFGWTSAPSEMTNLVIGNTPNKTILKIELWARAGGGGNKETASIIYDFVVICKDNPLIPDEIETIDVELSCTTAISGFKFDLLNREGEYKTKPNVGDFVMVYLAAKDEALDQKIISGYITEREAAGDPGNPIVKIKGEDLGQVFQDRTFTKKYTSSVLISQVIKDIRDAELTEISRYSVEDTDNSITPEYNEEGVFNLIRKLANASRKDTTYGFDFYVDPAGDLHFVPNPKYTGPPINDTTAKNINAISCKEILDDVVNEVKLLMREAFYEPRDRDAWTENIKQWSSPDGATFSEETGDKKEGALSVKASFSGAGTQIRLRRKVQVDLAAFKKIKFWDKFSFSGQVDYWVVRLACDDPPTSYYQRKLWVGQGAGIPKPWGFNEQTIANFTKVGNPSNDIVLIEIGLENDTASLGDGYMHVDGLHMALDAITKTASDSASQDKHGKKKRTWEDFTLTDEGLAQFIANALCQVHKNPIAHVHVTTPGKGQEGFRPPAKVLLKSTKDGILDEYFRILVARHQQKPGTLYECELDLIAARKPDGSYEVPIAYQPRTMRALTPGAELARRIDVVSRKGYYWI